MDERNATLYDTPEANDAIVEVLQILAARGREVRKQRETRGSTKAARSPRSLTNGSNDLPEAAPDVE